MIEERTINITHINKDFMHMSQFIIYPYDYLKEFSDEFNKKKYKMSKEDIERIIHLLEVDIFCLKMGLKNKIHPITGFEINTEHRTKEINSIIRRNEMWIGDLQHAIYDDSQLEMMQKSYYKKHKQDIELLK